MVDPVHAAKGPSPEEPLRGICADRCSRRSFLRAAGLLIPGALLAPGRATGSLPDHIHVPRAVPVDLGFIRHQLPLVPRIEWNNTLPQPWKLRVAELFDRITVHHSGATSNYHTARSDVLRDMEGVFMSHSHRNYGDIGYHFIIDYAGTVWEGRSLAYEGAHVASQNERNIGIVVLGNFENQQPSAKQTENLERLTRLLRARFQIKPHRIFGHRDLGHSVCPGQQLYTYVRQMRT
jgi:hypothetical protein